MDTQVSHMLVSLLTHCEISNSDVQENRRKYQKFLQRNEIDKNKLEIREIKCEIAF